MSIDENTNEVIKYLLEIQETTPKDDHDAIFKQLLTTCFKDFMEIFLPILAPQIDFENIDFLDK